MKAGHPHRLRARVTLGWRWFACVHTTDPVRRALNAGLSGVLGTLAVLAALMGIVVAAIGRPAFTVGVVFAVTPLCVVCWWLNRRGGTAGAWGLVLLLVTASSLAIDPRLYAGLVPTVDVAFMYGIVVAALFVRPGAAAIAWLLQLVALAVAITVARLPAPQVWGFLLEAAIELGALGAMAAAGARIVVQALRDAVRRADALATAEARGRRLVDASVVGIVIAELDGPILQVNDAFLTMLGYTRADFDAGRVRRHDYLPPDAQRVSRAAMQRLREGGSAAYEIDLLRRDGSRVPVLVSASRFEDSEQGVAFVLDMTEARRLEHERQRRTEAEAANLAKTAFLASMSHELRTPLNAVLGFTQLMLAQGSGTHEQQHWLALIEDSGSHLLRLVDEVLDLARVESGRLQLHLAPMPLQPFLERLRATGEVRARSKSLHFELHADAGLPDTVATDELRLRQVLLNLIENAVKFTPAGSVMLRVRMLPCDAPACCRLQLEVEDTGIGIAPADIERIFGAFERAGGHAHRQVGAGLGLTISQQLVRLMGGELQVHSEPAAGSRFFFVVELGLAG